MLDHPISELSGKVLSIVGYGELGSNVAHVARAFAMQVLIIQAFLIGDPLRVVNERFVAGNLL